MSGAPGARDPEYRTRLDQPLPDIWYREAARVAATLGQGAATAMMQAEQHKRMMARIDERHALAKARAGVQPHHRLGHGLVGLIIAATGAALAYAPVQALAAPWQAHGFAYVLCAAVAYVTIRAYATAPLPRG